VRHVFVFGVDVDLISFANTPLTMLVIILALTVLVAVVLMILTAAATPLVDKRWPADEPLNPTEMLWGETGGYIQKHFKGLDAATAKDLNSQMVELKVKSGQTIIEQGEPATHFFVIKEGEVEVSQKTKLAGGLEREDIIRRLGPGMSFGETAILRRTARTATVRAVADSTLLQLSAEDFVAGAAFSDAHDNSVLARVEEMLAADQRRQADGHRSGGGITFLDVEAATSMVTDDDTRPHWIRTHVVGPAGAQAWAAPDPNQAPVAELQPNVELQVLEKLSGWGQVLAENGWMGWVDMTRLVAQPAPARV
jgi:CRP-like cAMP-binding protein